MCHLPTSQPAPALQHDSTHVRVNNWTVKTTFMTSRSSFSPLSASEQRGADLFAEVLQCEGVHYIFGNPGTTELPLNDAMVTDRRISFWEAANQPRSFDYPFTVIELHLNRDGEGEGKMSIATKVIYDKKDNMLSLENFQTSPVLLNNIRREKVTH